MANRGNASPSPAASSITPIGTKPQAPGAAAPDVERNQAADERDNPSSAAIVFHPYPQRSHRLNLFLVASVPATRRAPLNRFPVADLLPVKRPQLTHKNPASRGRSAARHERSGAPDGIVFSRIQTQTLHSIRGSAPPSLRPRLADGSAAVRS